MKVYISADIEGVAGCTAWSETDPANSSEYPTMCQRMTAEVHAACEGAFAASATEIWIKDAHWNGRNIDATKLPNKGIRIIRGWSGHPYSMMQELNGEFAAAVFVGYHSRAGSLGNPLAHTSSGRTFQEVKINDRPASEFLINSYIAYREKVPVVFLSGDEALCQDSSAFQDKLVTVATMKGIGDSTLSLHPDEALLQIRTGVEKSLRQDLSRIKKSMPSLFRMELTYRLATTAYRSSYYPGAKLLDDTKVVYESKDYFDVLRFFMFAR